MTGAAHDAQLSRAIRSAHWCRYTEQQRPRVLMSLAAVGLFMVVGWPLIIYYTGWWGFVKYWLMPWLGYHFWMSE